MDVALDSNILIADPWLRSQSVRALLDYISSTPSRLLICEVVEKEVREHLKRQFAKYISNIQSAHNQALRNCVIGVPEFSHGEAVEKTTTRWEENFKKILNPSNAVLVPVNNDVLQEVIKRATERIPPCSESGEGLRDAIIWLSLLEYCKPRRINKTIAFISSNTRDFAESDNITLKKELNEDTKDYGVNIIYYPDLQSFLKQYAEPIAHITLEWVNSRIDYKEVETQIKDYLDQIDKKSILNITNDYQLKDPRYRGKYIMSGKTEVLSMVMNLADCFVWHFDDEHVEAGLEFMVHIEAEGDCVRSPQFNFLDDFDEQIREISSADTQRLPLFVNVGIHVSAEIINDEIKLLSVEDVASLI